MKKTKAYHHVSRYFFTRSSKVDPRRDGADGVAINKKQLPEIPKATMSGMRTYIRKMYRSSVRSTVKTDTMKSCGDPSSVSDDYHAQLRELDVVKPQ
jgi:hypothetical protein